MSDTRYENEPAVIAWKRAGQALLHVNGLPRNRAVLSAAEHLEKAMELLADNADEALSAIDRSDP